MTVTLGPSYELQVAMVAALRSSADVKSLIGNPARINPAQSDSWPGDYIEIGEGQDVPDLADCVDGSEIYFDIHIWSRADTSFAAIKKIAATIWTCLSSASLSLTENSLQEIERAGARWLRDPDGKTLHGVLTIRALTEPAA